MNPWLVVLLIIVGLFLFMYVVAMIKRPGSRYKDKPEEQNPIRGAEMFISTRSKSITRATILYAFHKVRKMGEQGIVITGPKSIGVHGDSYIYAVFKELGVINGSTLDSHDMIRVPGNLEETELKSMPRPKGSKNKKTTISTEVIETVESIESRIAAAEAAIETLTNDLKAKKAELKELVKLKAEAEKLAAEKKAEEDKAAILAAVEASGKSVEEILELLK